MRIRPINPSDIPAIHQTVESLWGSPIIVVHLEQYNCDDLPGFCAIIGDSLAWLFALRNQRKYLRSSDPGRINRWSRRWHSLMAAVEHFAAEKQCAHLQVATTNDNLPAIGFYKHLGFQIKEVYPGRIALARKIKPSIPMIGENGLSILDEILLEKEL